MDSLEGIRSHTRVFDPANYLETPEDMAAHLQAALLDGDSRIIAAALGNIARARGMAQLAEDTGLTRENLYVSLSDRGNPRLDTLLKVLSALGISLVAVPKKKSRPMKSPEKGSLVSGNITKKLAPRKAPARGNTAG